MRKMLMATVAVALLVGGSVALALNAGVEIKKDGFHPRDVSIQSGDSVTWKNSDTAAHQVSVDKTSCALKLEPAQSGSCTFGTAGKFKYKDPGAKGGGFAGTVKVAANTRSVMLSSSRSVMIFGGATVLSGTVSTRKAGETVTIVAQPAGEPTWSTQVATTKDGMWSLQVQPRIRTTYQARFEGASSPSVAVSVRPRVTLQKIGRDRFLVVVVAARSMAGRTVDVARWANGRWTTMAQLQLRGIARTSTIAVNAFTSYVKLGTKLRIYMASAQTGPDYIDGHSNFVFK